MSQPSGSHERQAGFSEKIRVRYSEVDAQAIVFNAHYLTYLDLTFTEYMRHLGFTLDQQLAVGLDPVLAKANVHFTGPARLDDILEVCPRVVRLGRTSLTMAYEIYREATGRDLAHRAAGEPRSPIVLAENLYVNVDLTTGRPVDIPPAVRVVLEREVAAATAGAAGCPALTVSFPPHRLFLELGARDGWCMVHCPDLPGLGYKAASRDAALVLAPGRLAAEAAWAQGAGIAGGSGCAAEMPALEVAGEVTSDVPVASGDTEATFPPDLEPLAEAYLAYVLSYTRASRRTLLDLVDRLGPGLADWRSAEGKRTIGEVLGHIADAEAFYAVRLEHPAQPGGPEQPEGPQAAAELWKRYAGRDLGLGPVERLVRTRELVVDRLGRLSDEDRVRVIELRGETWTARKVLRRLAWHERYHTRQIESWLAP